MQTNQKTRKFQTIQPIVEQILEAHPKARDNDNLLYCFYLNAMGYSKSISVWDMCFLVKEKTIASMETVGRIRRKIQEQRPELGSSLAAAVAKEKKQYEFVEYARS